MGVSDNRDPCLGCPSNKSPTIFGSALWPMVVGRSLAYAGMRLKTPWLASSGYAGGLWVQGPWVLQGVPSDV